MTERTAVVAAFIHRLMIQFAGMLIAVVEAAPGAVLQGRTLVKLAVFNELVRNERQFGVGPMTADPSHLTTCRTRLHMQRSEHRRIVAGGILIGLIAGAVCGQPRAAEAPAAAGWRSLFDGERLGDWRVTAFGGEGEVEVVEGAIRIGMGADLSGITWQGEFPEQSYEIALEARRVDGNDFFCGLTFPVGDDACSLILGGWGGAVTGLSSIDGHDAADNGTTQVRAYETNQWYDVVVRVTPPAEDRTPADDVQAADIEVVERITQVLIVSSGPGREYQFLRNLLHRDRTFAVDVLLGTATSGVAQDARRMLDAFPASDEALAAYDAIVAIDPDWRL
ncbi:hypothetical protein EBR04_11240, partial [bacterium]|nr:hypothetical protein [bacterium]